MIKCLPPFLKGCNRQVSLPSHPILLAMVSSLVARHSLPFPSSCFSGRVRGQASLLAQRRPGGHPALREEPRRAPARREPPQGPSQGKSGRLFTCREARRGSLGGTQRGPNVFQNQTTRVPSLALTGLTGLTGPPHRSVLARETQPEHECHLDRGPHE